MTAARSGALVVDFAVDDRKDSCPMLEAVVFFQGIIAFIRIAADRHFLHQRARAFFGPRAEGSDADVPGGR